jgi:hypothetical protein
MAGDTATLITLDCSSLEQAPSINRVTSNTGIKRASFMMFSEIKEMNDLIKN